MTAETLKSTQITNLDASPVVANTAGSGASANLKTISATILPTDAKTAPSFYKMVRLPWHAKIKHVYVQAAAATDFDADIGIYYSDSTVDGTPAALQGTVLTGNVDFFAAAFDFDAAIVAMIDVAYLNPSEGYLITDNNGEFWAAANSGLTSNPGGYFDVVLTTTVTNSVPLAIYLEVQYTD